MRTMSITDRALVIATITACGLLMLCACRRESTAPRALSWRLTRPQSAEGVFLNEDLIFYFSGEIDRASVTRESARIQSRAGEPAAGRWIVEGDHLRFEPAPVLSSDLRDGGYLPDTRYDVEIRGFPLPDGLRGVHGEPLVRTYRYSFHTVAITEPRTSLVFVDGEPELRKPLRFFPLVRGSPQARYEIRAQDSLYLKSDKPIDPSTVHSESFVLMTRGRAAPPIRLRARLIENEPEARAKPRGSRAPDAALDFAWDREPRAALLELTPVDRLVSNTPGGYQLSHVAHALRWRLAGVEAATRLRTVGAIPILRIEAQGIEGPLDMSGHPVWDPLLANRPIVVVENGLEARRGAYTEHFLKADLRSPIEWPHVDGTAAWSETGRVEVRFPAAAGSGVEGNVRLAGACASRDVQSVRCEVPSGEIARLPSEPGLVVIRAQGKLSISGRLERRAGAVTPMSFAGGSLSKWLDAAAALPREAQADSANWTVLVAGGDIVVDGAVDVSTPILLCAGGMIRITGTVAAAHGQRFRLGEGGGGNAGFDKAVLEIDPPLVNPLREELRFAVLSAPIPERGQSSAWKSAEAPRGSDNTSGRSNGAWRVRYLPDSGGDVRDLESIAPVDDPRLLGSTKHIRFLVELTLRPGPRWDPPFVDSVSLEWNEAPPPRAASSARASSDEANRGAR